MTIHKKGLDRVTQGLFAVGLFAESERLLLATSLRDTLSGAMRWPYVYTSDFGIAIPTGVACGWLGYKLGAKAIQSLGRFDLITKATSESKTITTAAQVVAGASLAVVPIGMGVQFELAAHCEPHEAEALYCQPDPIDAATVVIGGLLGVHYILNREETASRAQRPYDWATQGE